jgi:hypothetical protein
LKIQKSDFLVGDKSLISNAGAFDPPSFSKRAKSGKSSLKKRVDDCAAIRLVI